MEVGTLVATKYRLTERLGQGTTGVVFAARHEKTGNEVALKVVAPHRAHQRRALREARAACAVEHPNLVPIWDILEEEDGTTILVMARLRGASLRARLADTAKMSARDTAALAEGIFSGLEALHRAGVVHRDLKPDNVFVVEGDEPLAARVRILDFGIAKLMPEAQRDETALTESGAMLGTPKYMAPEQAFGEADVDARADLWAAGAVLYECLTGALPAPGDNLGQIMKRLAQGAIVPLSEHAVDVPEPLRGLIADLLVVDREKRLATAEEALARLHGEVVKAQPADAPPQPAARRTAAPWVWLAGVAVAAGAVGLVALALRHDEPAGPTATASATTASSPPTADVPSTTVSIPTATASATALPTATARLAPHPTAGVSAGPSAAASTSASAHATSRILDNPPF